MASSSFNRDDRICAVFMCGMESSIQDGTVYASNFGKLGVGERARRYKNENVEEVNPINSCVGRYQNLAKQCSFKLQKELNYDLEICMTRGVRFPN